jgi:hypothetical protein
VDDSLLNESTLGFGHEVIHKWPKSNIEHLHDDFCNSM